MAKYSPPRHRHGRWLSVERPHLSQSFRHSPCDHWHKLEWTALFWHARDERQDAGDPPRWLTSATSSLVPSIPANPPSTGSNKTSTRSMPSEKRLKPI